VTTWTTFVSIHQHPEIKDRPNDLPLLQESVKENPTDVRLWGYLAREYSYRGHFDECVKTYKHFLFLGGDPQERILAYQYIAKYSKDEAVECLHKAMEEAPAYREPIVALAMHYYENGRWQECYDAAIKSLGLTLRPNSYICRSETWGALPHDLAAISAYNLGLYQIAENHGKIALDLAPDDERLKSNVVFYTQKPLEAA
jgi:tetratricopeptide (TPR) repeat protein